MYLSGQSHIYDQFIEKTSYYRLEEGDKIVDITGGKHYHAVVTEKGQVRCGGYIFYRHFGDCRNNPESNEDYEFQLNLPDGYKAKNIFGCEKYSNVWVTAADQQGNLKTFGAGHSIEMTGHGLTHTVSQFHALLLPDGVYMTKITSQR